MSGRIPRCHLFVPVLDKVEIGAYDTANNTGFGLAGMHFGNGHIQATPARFVGVACRFGSGLRHSNMPNAFHAVASRLTRLGVFDPQIKRLPFVSHLLCPILTRHSLKAFR